MNELKPCVVAASEAYDYDVRAEALRIIRCGEVDLTHPKLREVVMCLSSIAFAGLMEYYGGWDFENAGWTLAREHGLADDLAHIEAKLLQTHDGSTELKAMKRQLAEQEVELRRAWDDGPPARPRLVPGAIPSLRGLALLRAREREANAE